MIEKILLDTDIGTDIDDAIVMSYLLKQKKCEIVGITVTGGETEKRAALASVMCHAAGKPDIPINAYRLNAASHNISKKSDLLDR